MKILNIVGARPNFMKIAPILRQLRHYPEIDWQLVHTGQHYEDNMSKIFFKDLEMLPPDIFLGVGSCSHAEQTARMLVKLEQVMQEYQPDLVLVVGDVNSTLAGALAAAKLNIPVAHVEAGLRSFDRSMPEEINRLCVDCFCELFFTTSRTAGDNLRRTHIPEEKIHFVGNVMVDSLYHARDRAFNSPILEKLQLQPQQYAVVTMHHPSSVDNREVLSSLLDTIAILAEQIPIVFPVHPRTTSRLQDFGLQNRLSFHPQITLTSPLGYLDFLKLLSASQFVLTDSSGIQEDTTVLGVPCLTLLENTERPETVIGGTNVLVGLGRDRILEAAFRILDGKAKVGCIPELWDGKAAQRIVEAIVKWWNASHPQSVFNFSSSAQQPTPVEVLGVRS